MKHAAILGILPLFLLWGCGNDAPKEAKPTAAGENPLNAPADYLGAAVKAKQKAEKTVGAASVDQAIKVFAAQENRYPTNLDELVSSKVIPKLPTLPPGMKFDYDAATGTAKIVPEK
jgi:hypothetical protein